MHLRKRKSEFFELGKILLSIVSFLYCLTTWGNSNFQRYRSFDHNWPGILVAENDPNSVPTEAIAEQSVPAEPGLSPEVNPQNTLAPEQTQPIVEEPAPSAPAEPFENTQTPNSNAAEVISNEAAQPSVTEQLPNAGFEGQTEGQGLETPTDPNYQDPNQYAPTGTDPYQTGDSPELFESQPQPQIEQPQNEFYDLVDPNDGGDGFFDPTKEGAIQETEEPVNENIEEDPYESAKEQKPQGETIDAQQLDYEEQWKEYEKQQLEAWRKFYRVPSPPVKESKIFASASPALSISIPIGFGSEWGNVFGGITYVHRTRYTPDSDGVAAGGFGVGDGRKYIGGTIVIAIIDLIGDTFADGSIGGKIHRQINDTSSVALGVENMIPWGSISAARSFYASFTKMIHFSNSPDSFLSMMAVTAGAGTGRFLPESKNIDGTTFGINVFGGVGIRLFRPLSAIANWTGQNLDVGISIAPLKNFSLVITPSIADLLPTAGDGPRFAINFSVSLSLANKSKNYPLPQ